MSDVIFLMIAISFLVVAFLTAVATTSASPRVRRIVNRVSMAAVSLLWSR